MYFLSFPLEIMGNRRNWITQHRRVNPPALRVLSVPKSFKTQRGNNNFPCLLQEGKMRTATEDMETTINFCRSENGFFGLDF